MSEPIVIVGGGLAGSIPAKVLESHGRKVTVIDNQDLYGASRNSENLFSHTWANTLGKTVTTSGINLLHKYFPITTIPFWTGKRTNETLHVHPRDILYKNYVHAQVTEVGNGFVKTDDGRTFKGIVLVAAGFWCDHLVDIPKVDALSGHGFLFEGTLTDQPRMDFWAPYRHQKIFQWSPNRIWYADSTTILDDNYFKGQEKFINKSLQRASKFFDLALLRKTVFGRRPFCPHQKKGFYKKLDSKLYVSTSGWKCGLVIYANQARLFCKDIGVEA